MSTVNQEGGDAIACYACGRDVSDYPNWQWEADYDPEWQGHRRGGSANTDMIGNAAYLAFGAPEQQQQMVTSWLAFFAQSRDNWQRTEQFSIIYSIWHVLPVLLVYKWAKLHNHSDLLRESRLWLLNWWAVCRLCESRVRGGRLYIPVCGERSSMGTANVGDDHDPCDNHFGHHALWSEARGENWSGRSRSVRWEPEDAVNDFVGRSIVGFSQEIRETAAPVLACSLSDVLRVSPQYTARVPVYIYRGERGVAVWWGWQDEPGRDASGNNNTGPILALLVCDGEIESCPPRLGVHYRQRGSQANAWLDAATNIVHWRWDELVEFGVSPAGVLDLYRLGHVVQFTRIGPSGWTDLLALPDDVPAPNPGPPSDPATTPPASGAAGDGPEVVAWERPGKYVALWSGRARVLGWPADDGRTIVVFDQEGDPE